MMLIRDPTRAKSFSKRRSPSISEDPKHYYRKLSLYLATPFITVLILSELQVLKHLLFPFSSVSLRWDLSGWLVTQTLDFAPLKNASLSSTAMDGTTWFMSSLNNTFEPGEAEYLLFPSNTSDGRLLCVSGNDARDGARNKYAFASPDALPWGAKLFPGLTFVSDTYYSYDNLCHGLAAVAPFVAWHDRKGCQRPTRWVLYHRGEVRSSIGPWVGSMVEAVFGKKAEMERFKGRGGSMPNCFEKAVVFRHNEGMMSRDRKEEMYGIVRCKARAYCNWETAEDGSKDSGVRLTLLLRTGPRSFKDDDAVARIFDRECSKVDGCRLTVARPNKLTFGDQVKLMSSTDILASPHSAQMTNMIFMDRNSSVMEFFPKGWLKLAGPGQYVYHWLASSSGMQHKGAWRDLNGEPCPYPENDPKCFPFYKHGRIGHDEAYFANWTANVLREMRDYKLLEGSRREKSSNIPCQCS